LWQQGQGAIDIGVGLAIGLRYLLVERVDLGGQGVGAAIETAALLLLGRLPAARPRLGRAAAIRLGL